MANKNFEIKNGLTVAGTERITAAGAGSLTNLTLSGNLTVQGTTVTLDASTLQVADKNIVLNYHASNDTSSTSSGAGITIQDAVNGTTDATILWDASDDEFDFSHGVNITNLKVGGAQGTDGQLLTSTGSGVAWEDAPASGPTFKAFGTSSIMVGDSTTGTINAADYNTGLGIDVFANLTSGDQNTVLGFEAGNALTVHNQNTLIGYQAGKLLGGSSESWEAQRNVFIGYGAGLNVDEGQRAIAIGYYAMMSSLGTTTNDIAIGYQAMQYRQSNTGDSIAIGYNAHRGDINQGYQNANRNVAVGTNTLSIIETGGMQNTAIGWYAGQNATTGPYNTLIGSEAGQAVSTGQKNTLIGHQAGELITSGSSNVVLGGYDGNEGGLDIRTVSNRVVISDGAGNIRMYIDNGGNVGIGLTNPTKSLSVKAPSGSNGGIDVFHSNGNKVAELVHHGSGDEGRLSLYDGGANTIQLHGETGQNSYINSGNVGIGYASPGQKLQIAEATNYAPPGLGSNGGHFGIFKIDSGIPKYGILTGVASSGKVWQQVQRIDSTATAYNLMLQPSGGNIEIGTSTNVGFAGQTAPNTPIHVGTSTSTGPIIQISHENIGGFGSLDIDAYGSATLRLISNFSGSTMNGVATGKFGLVTPHGRDIVFGTSGVERFRISAGKTGIAFNSDTAQANHLDDYEEGTWTPVLQNVTTSSISFYSLYTKIGRICHIHCKITATVASLPGANFAISGLPFPAKDSSDSQQRALIAIGGDSQNLGSYANGRAHFRTNGSQLQGVWLNSGSTAYWNYNSMDHTTFEIHLHGQYTV